MKTIIVLALILAVTSAQFCVLLVQDDTTCTGSRTKWPAKVCNSVNVTLNSKTYCDAAGAVGTWKGLCPVKNLRNTSFCDSTGYAFAYRNATFCNSNLKSCTANSDCVAAPVASAPAAPSLFCFDCCLFCFNQTTCNAKVAEANPIYTNRTACTPCAPVTPIAAPVKAPVKAPVAAPVKAPVTNTPMKTPSKTPSRTPRTSDAAPSIVSVSMVLAVAAGLALH